MASGTDRGVQARLRSDTPNWCHHRVQLKVAVISRFSGLLLTSNPASRDWPEGRAGPPSWRGFPPSTNRRRFSAASEKRTDAHFRSRPNPGADPWRERPGNPGHQIEGRYSGGKHLPEPRHRGVLRFQGWFKIAQHVFPTILFQPRFLLFPPGLFILRREGVSFSPSVRADHEAATQIRSRS
jgi:hypothetical protein